MKEEITDPGERRKYGLNVHDKKFNNDMLMRAVMKENKKVRWDMKPPKGFDKA